MKLSLALTDYENPFLHVSVRLLIYFTVNISIGTIDCEINMGEIKVPQE